MPLAHSALPQTLLYLTGDYYGKGIFKTKYDNEMKMEIPHNHNFASAMFGFREMAAEIVPYHLIDDIYDDFKREDIALDYIDQCNVLFNKFGGDTAYS